MLHDRARDGERVIYFPVLSSDSPTYRISYVRELETFVGSDTIRRGVSQTHATGDVTFLSLSLTPYNSRIILKQSECRFRDNKSARQSIFTVNDSYVRMT